MTPFALLATAGLLGLFVLFAGGYGLLYGMGQLRHRADLLRAGYASYAMQCAVMVAVLAFTPLLDWWKAFIAVSCALYFFIPPVTWRYLTHLHRLEGPET